jgi:phosphatidylserine/phosphatidylglycerophosphate/cardiolipin synthase-like enzyme
VIEVRTLVDGGQPADTVAAAAATFLDDATSTLDLALYDVRLTGPAGDRVRKALEDASARGVRVRVLYNVDHPGPIPVPAPPETQPDLIEALPAETRGIAGVPDLMHHKYVVRDGAALWSGSTNWTNDSWTRQENVITVVTSDELAHAFSLNFEELWSTGDVARSGAVEPRRVRLDGAEAQPWFCPLHGEQLAHRIAKRLGQAQRRIRIASPVLTSGPVLGTLSEIVSEHRCDVAGIVDDTQVDEVFGQWRSQGVSMWKVPLLQTILERAPFSGKESTPWSPTAVHDYMHAKVTIADDVSFVGSFNLSRSGEQNAENVLEIRDAALADRLAAYVDDIRARYPAATVPAATVGNVAPAPPDSA